MFSFIFFSNLNLVCDSTNFILFFIIFYFDSDNLSSYLLYKLYESLWRLVVDEENRLLKSNWDFDFGWDIIWADFFWVG
jgi:hypothetical protein